MKIKSSPYSNLVAVLANLLLAYAVYMLTRVAFVLENWNLFAADWGSLSLWEVFSGSLRFDSSAILYTNSLWIVLMLLPLHLKERPWWQTMCKWIFVVINSLCLVINLVDSVYSQFTGRRTTATFFSEFSNEDNLGGIVFTELFNHWYLFLCGIAMIAAIWFLYVKPSAGGQKQQQTSTYRRNYYIIQSIALAIAIPMAVFAMRGGFTRDTRPITISNANQYVNRPTDAALVLNTPFSFYRTIGKNVFVVPDYYESEEEMAQVYSPIHVPNDSVAFTPKNVVVLIVESFGREYIGALNKTLENGQYKGYTPHIDSLIAKSTTFKYSFCNGRKSIDGMPSILSSIPMFVEPFFLTPSSMNHVSGIASLLDTKGYQTAFFHGAQRGSMGFMAFARSTGFQEYYGREDFNEDPRFDGDKDFDGMWAIWDEPFLQYYCTKMSEMKEPFMTAVFTASSHHPYEIPEEYKDVYPEEGIIMHKCIRYTDMALGKFFQAASRQPWFKNTIFVLTSDHTNMSDHDYYQTDLGGFCSPIIIYEPGDTLRQPEMQDKIAQQIDILPTVMGMLHYDQPYFGFGIDLFNTAAEDTWAVNYLNGIYQYVKHGHVLQFDGERTTAIYALQDSLMQHNLLNDNPQTKEMEREVKAIIQQYMERMTQDRLQP